MGRQDRQCTRGMAAVFLVCREAASAELEHRTMLDAKAALDQMVLISDSTDLYGPLADGLGK